MAKKISNPNFFKENIKCSVSVEENVNKNREAAEEALKGVRPPMRISGELTSVMRDTAELMRSIGHITQAKLLERVYMDAIKEKFSIAVVGEFSKGKSTFINRLLGKDILPTSNLPTTAMLTRICYSSRETLSVYDENGKLSKTMPLEENIWAGLVADNLHGNDFRGTAAVGYPSEWLGKNSIEIIDTPGAGDVNEKRSRLIGEALVRSDGAIIAIDATCPLSMSEKLFISQRLIARRIPFLILIINKLDKVDISERKEVVGHIIAELKRNGMPIPVYIPYDIEMPDNTYDKIIGIETVKKRITMWLAAPTRVNLTESWLSARSAEIINMSITLLKEKKRLSEKSESERLKLIEENKKQLSEALLKRDKLILEMNERCNACFIKIHEKIKEYGGNISERLQYEAANTPDPQKWWNESYSYRLKTEIANLSVNVDAAASKIIAEDIKRLNFSLAELFKIQVPFANTFETKDIFNDGKNNAGNINFKDNIRKQRNMVRIGTTAASIIGAVGLSLIGAGPLSLIATMGLGTGSSIISETVFKNKIDEQRKAVKNAIAVNVPEIADTAASDCENRIILLYESICGEAKEKTDMWFKTRSEALNSAAEPLNKDDIREISGVIDALEHCIKKLSIYTNVQ